MPMRSFVLRFFAVIGLVSAILSAGAIYFLFFGEGAPPEPEAVVLTLDLDQPIIERPDESPITAAIQERSIPLLSILQAIDRAKADPHVKALVASFGSEQPSLAQAQEIRAAVARFRASGKPAYAFGTDYGGFGFGSRAYYLASAFENIWLQPSGTVGLMNAAVQAPFAKTALDKLGVSPDFMQREEYKSVMEAATRDDFSQPARANMQSMMDDMERQITEGIAESRKWDAARVNQLLAGGPYTAGEALKAELVTKLGYMDELDKEIDKVAGEDAVRADLDEYMNYSGGKKGKPKAHIALIYGLGMIVDHAPSPSGITGKAMGADEIAGAFDDVAGNKDVDAIIFRVDSPGGSPEASETIRRALVHAQEKGKPVFISMGDVAASGGYWVSMNGDKIIAEPGTLTGSIGVVAGKFSLGGLMQKLGVKWQMLSTGGNAGIWSITDDFSPGQRARVNALLDETYHDFLQNVSTARKIPMEKMPDVAKGRVFTGAQAAKAGLVDILGGYDAALGAVREKLKLEPSDVIAINVFPPPVTPAERVLKILKNIGIESAMVRSILVQWREAQVLIGPLWSAVSGFGSPVALRAPDLAGIRE